MKFFFALVLATIALVHCVSAFSIFNPGTKAPVARCQVPCTATKTLLCASNGPCFNTFTDNCVMEKWNCENNDTFSPRPLMNCLMNKNCQHVQTT